MAKRDRKSGCQERQDAKRRRETQLQMSRSLSLFLAPSNAETGPNNVPPVSVPSSGSVPTQSTTSITIHHLEPLTPASTAGTSANMSAGAASTLPGPTTPMSSANAHPSTKSPATVATTTMSTSNAFKSRAVSAQHCRLVARPPMTQTTSAHSHSLVTPTLTSIAARDPCGSSIPTVTSTASASSIHPAPPSSIINPRLPTVSCQQSVVVPKSCRYVSSQAIIKTSTPRLVPLLTSSAAAIPRTSTVTISVATSPCEDIHSRSSSSSDDISVPPQTELPGTFITPTLTRSHLTTDPPPRTTTNGRHVPSAIKSTTPRASPLDRFLYSESTPVRRKVAFSRRTTTPSSDIAAASPASACHSPASPNASPNDSGCTESSMESSNIASLPSVSSSTGTTEEISRDDIATALLHPGGPTMLPDSQKLHLLQQTVKPSGDPIDWPFEFRNGKKRKITQYCYDMFGKWLTYSHHFKGLFCKYCVFFAASVQQTGRLVTRPCTKFSRLTGDGGYLDNHHFHAEYHNDSIKGAKNFIHCCTNKRKDIIVSMDSAVDKRKQRNRRIITTIVEIIVLCGRMGSSYRGHRDDGAVLPPATINDIVTKSGHFRTLVQLYSLANPDLRDHLNNAPGNASYVSKTIQNELISLMGTSISTSIAEDVKDAKYYTILADETTDAARESQLSISLRYVHNGNIVERFIGFVHPESLSGVGLANEILAVLKKLGIDITHVVGQGYDGAAAMSSGGKGVHGVIKSHCGDQAVFVHCAAHVLNLTLMKASEVPQIRNAFGTISSVATFFNQSSVRSAQLQTELDKIETSHSKRSVKVPCQTRWVEKHEAVHTLFDLYSPVQDVLEKLSTETGAATKDAHSLLTCTDTTEFVVSLCILNEVMKVTKQLSTALQSAGNSLIASVSHIKTVRAQLDVWRNDENRFKSIAENAKSLLGTEELALPRLTGRQTKRCNVPHSNATEYYRRSIYLPFMDCLLSQFDSRFANHGKTVLLLSGLLPKMVQVTDFSAVEEGVKLYEHLLPGDIDTIKIEFEAWKIHCTDTESAADDCLAALDICPKAFYPNIHDLIQIYATLPVSTATAERTFSALKQIKSYLRSTMREERLNGLALAYIHKELNVEQTVKEIVRLFALDNRRILL